MESASEAPGAMAADEATCDPSLLSAAPPPPAPPAPASSASTKRRWSPCTWRYAIEDAQAELPSRPRATAPLSTTALPPSSRASHSSPSQQQQQQPIKAKPPCYNPLYGKAVEEPQKISSCPPHVHVVVETRVRSSASQPPAHFKSRSRELYRKSHHHLHSSKARPCEEDAEEEDGEAEQDIDDYDDHQGLTVYDEEYFKMRRREMSPSELYFCAICSTKGEETKGSAEPCAYKNS